MKPWVALVSLLLLAPRATRTDCTAREAFQFRFTEIPVVPTTTIELILTRNNITNLSSGAFSHIPALKILRLDDNQLATLSSDYFDSLPQLETLVLDGNSLQEIPADSVFVNLTSLLELSIQNTPLTELNGEVFLGLSVLTTLSLDENQLYMLSNDFLEHLPLLTLLSLTGNHLESLPDGFLNGAPVTTAQLDLQDNPWSCDCRLQWLADYTEMHPGLISDGAVCLWPLALATSPLNTLSSGNFQCDGPSIIQQPQNDSILTDAPYSLEVIIDGAPFPDVVWYRDGEIVNYTDRVFVAGYDASLMFTTVANGDAGVYSVLLTNNDGSVESINATLFITEATCVDEEFTESHETDVDCGGPFCTPCPHGMRCLLDGDCAGELVCLYSHLLPSQLHYMTRANPLAYTCANSSVPRTLLQSLLSAMSDIPLVVTGNSSKQEIEELFHSFLTETLSVSRDTLTGVSVNSVERQISPLLQFEAQVVQNCQETVANLNSLINSGALKATLKTSEGQGNVCYSIRLNI